MIRRGWALALAMALTLPVLGAFAPAHGQGKSMEEMRDQGILYYKRDIYPQAMNVLNKAYKAPGGSQDFKTVFYRGRTAHQLLLLEVAFEMAKDAQQLAGENERAKQLAQSFQEELNSLYGAVNVKLDKKETNKRGRIFLKSKTGIINREKKKVFVSIRTRFENTEIDFPAKIYLPFGEYTANNIPFKIVKGQPEPTVEVFLQIEDVGGGGLNAWWITGIAGAATVAAGVGAYFIFRDNTVTEDRANLGLVP